MGTEAGGETRAFPAWLIFLNDSDVGAFPSEKALPRVCSPLRDPSDLVHREVTGEAGLWEASVCTVMIKVIGDKMKVTSGNTGLMWGMVRGEVNLGGIYASTPM